MLCYPFKGCVVECLQHSSKAGDIAGNCSCDEAERRPIQLDSSAPHTVYESAKSGHSNIITAANYGL